MLSYLSLRWSENGEDRNGNWKEILCCVAFGSGFAVEIPECLFYLIVS